jgi:predicted kinase
MEAVVFVGLQASGKSTFHRERFANTHLRINLDMLKTRHREDIILKACIESKQPFVVDNTNPTPEERAKYIAAAKGGGFRVVGYYFRSSISECVARNAARGETVPERGIRGTHGRLVIPSRAEGFDELFYVATTDDGGFTVQEWQDEV